MILPAILMTSRKYQNLSGYLRIDLYMITANFCVILVLIVVFKVYCATLTLLNINNKLDINLKFNLKYCKRG